MRKSRKNALLVHSLVTQLAIEAANAMQMEMEMRAPLERSQMARGSGSTCGKNRRYLQVLKNIK